jgi:methylthioribose-1-phosphate isomerase
MNVEGKPFRTIREEGDHVRVIDQRYLPHQFVLEDLKTLEDMAVAIRDMHIRGAGLIGAAAGYGMYLAARETAGKTNSLDLMRRAGEYLKSTRPTAVNLAWAVDRQLDGLKGAKDSIKATLEMARKITDEEAEACRQIGLHGVTVLEKIHSKNPDRSLNILTHCNAGWLAFVDYGSATAPIYEAHRRGIPVHVWVDETRPRNQGASLTAWELGQEGVPHTVIADNTGGHLMQHGMVDCVITGADRVTATGDAANKIGTYLKALAAKDNGVPFYIAFPESTLDWNLSDGIKQIPIEERGSDEVRWMEGWCDGEIKRVRVTPEKSPAKNYGFDVTPARLITGLMTNHGVCEATEHGIRGIFKK